jgi:hypothetical protein
LGALSRDYWQHNAIQNKIPDDDFFSDISNLYIDISNCCSKIALWRYDLGIAASPRSQERFKGFLGKSSGFDDNGGDAYGVVTLSGTSMWVPSLCFGSVSKPWSQQQRRCLPLLSWGRRGDTSIHLFLVPMPSVASFSFAHTFFIYL